MSEFHLRKLPNKQGNDTMHIRIGGRKITGHLSVYKFQDKDTKQFVLYVPSLEVTSYGESEEKASEMIKTAIQDYFDYLVSMPSKKVAEELSQLGWKKHWIKNKEYSKAYVDISGELKNLNAIEDKVEMLTLETA